MATINDLPNELLLLIFRLLGETANAQAVSSVCRRWDQLIVPTLRLRIGLYDDGDRGVRDILCRSSRQYEAVALDFPESSCETTDIGDRTGLWILARFMHVTDVELRFYKYDLKRIKLFFGGRIDDVPQLPAVRYLFLYGLTGDRIYSRFVQRAPNLTKLTVDQDAFLDDDAIVCICNGLPQLADLHLKIHSAVELTETAFGAIHLLTQLQRFHISFENISRQVWLGEWFKRLPAPTVSIENMFLPVVMPLAEFELLLANLRTRVLTLRKIFVAVWHRTIRQEVARVRPDLQFFYLEPVDTTLFG
ncbi:predicted protein [Culex quinquefasciatus]|uniref:Predicted protein n=1 Tax=Culex quinquefasciatus TaxID=7176 RepID=B0XGU4_CULQU|nr:predicted protein [Culex quinquefasciatus]|eukprot:XP_001868866.1 predicted protein [Culex quinquefasciatus]